jgi:phosphatidylserine/phosphatidylglycerophosphate/cardiolipin synthase-like enzyme
MHAKLLAPDAKIALLSSANLTDMALGDNPELGLLIRDPEVARRIVGHFRSLMRPGIGPLERVTNLGLSPVID